MTLNLRVSEYDAISNDRDKAGASEDDNDEPGIAREELDAGTEQMGEEDIENMGAESEVEEEDDEEEA